VPGPGLPIYRAGTPAKSATAELRFSEFDKPHVHTDLIILRTSADRLGTIAAKPKDCLNSEGVQIRNTPSDQPAFQVRAAFAWNKIDLVDTANPSAVAHTMGKNHGDVTDRVSIARCQIRAASGRIDEQCPERIPLVVAKFASGFLARFAHETFDLARVGRAAQKQLHGPLHSFGQSPNCSDPRRMLKPVTNRTAKLRSLSHSCLKEAHPMNVLLLGSGGREHALAWAITASPLLTTLYAAPGNAGIAKEAEIVKLDVANHADVISFCKEK